MKYYFYVTRTQKTNNVSIRIRLEKSDEHILFNVLLEEEKRRNHQYPVLNIEMQ